MIPEAVNLHKKSATLELTFEGKSYPLPAEFLRVHSPSAEVKGHHGAGGQLPYGKESVKITDVKPVGNYALVIVFDDGHNSGLYSWQYCWQLCQNQEQYWQTYLQQLHEKGLSRKTGVQVIKL